MDISYSCSLSNLLLSLEAFDKEQYLEIDREKIRRCYLMFTVSEIISETDLQQPWSIILDYMKQNSRHTLPFIFFRLLTQELTLHFWSNNLMLIKELAIYLVYGIAAYEQKIPEYQKEKATEFANQYLINKLNYLNE